jgi:cyclohexa-1,5-dienecarbonyl-CoA hydratase
VSGYSTIRVEDTHEGRRLRIVLAGGKGNVVDTAMATELTDALETFTRGKHLRAVALEAEGKHFSFGASVEEHAPDKAAALLEGLHAVVRAMLCSDLPVLVAIRGACLGGGLELVLPCHRVFATPDAKLGQPEITLGMFAPAGSALLPGRVGRAAAEDLLLSGRVVSGTEGAQIGLVDEIAEDPEAAATTWFEKNLLPRSAVAVRQATRAARAAWIDGALAALDRVEHAFLDELMQTADAQEGVVSFLEKRAPTWVDA